MTSVFTLTTTDMNISHLTKQLIENPAVEQQVADFISAGGDHVYISGFEKKFPYTDAQGGAVEVELERRTHAIFETCAAAGRTAGLAVLSLTKFAPKDLTGLSDPQTIPTRKIKGSGWRKFFGIEDYTYQLTPGQDTYRHFEPLDLGEGNDCRYLNFRFVVRDGVVDFFWRTKNGHQLMKAEGLQPGKAYHIVVHSLNNTEFEPMWRCRDVAAKVGLISLEEVDAHITEKRAQTDDWYDLAAEPFPKPKPYAIIIPINTVHCRAPRYENRQRREDYYRNVDALQARFGHHANRGADWIYMDELDCSGWPSVLGGVPPFVNAGDAFAHEVKQAALYVYHVTGHKPRGWWDMFQLNHSAQVYTRANNPDNGGFEMSRLLIPDEAPIVPALWNENPPVTTWHDDLWAESEREKAVCIYAGKTDPRTVAQAVNALPEYARPVEVIIYNTENEHLALADFQAVVEAFRG